MSRVALILLTALAAFAQEPPDKNYQAIRNNDLAAIRNLAKSSDVNASDARGGTPLMYAAFVGSSEALKMLLDAGAEVNTKNAFDVTPLMLAASDPAKVKMLLAKGADVNARSKLGRTALLIAASRDGNSESVRLLLEKGADIKPADTFLGMNALIAASLMNDADSLRLLLVKGADANSKDQFGNTALMWAASYGNIPAMKLLLAQGADVNAVSAKDVGPPVKNGPIDLGNFTALLMAATYGGVDAVKLLLDAGAKVNVQDVRGMTPLMFAIASDRPDPGVVRLLLAKGADTGIKSRTGETAVDWAKKFNHPAVMDALGLAQTRASAVLIQADDRKAPSAREAATKSIALLQRTSDGFFKEGGCVGCHAQNVTGMAVSVARTNGIAVDQRAAAEQLKATRLEWVSVEPLLMQGVDPPGTETMLEYSMWPMAWEHMPGDHTTDAMLHTIAREQRRDGGWHDGGVARPPVQDGDFAGTALAIRMFQVYGFAGRKAEFDERISRAAAWLRKAEPRTTEDRNMQLLGLQWAGGDAQLRDRLRRQVLAAQRKDGGWAQTPELASDAYATGQTLFTLHEAGVPASDAAYRRGTDFLLNTQLADSSWHVISRAPKLQPYFQSGFPHNHDQWISSMGTAWATIALSYGVGEKQVAAR